MRATIASGDGDRAMIGAMKCSRPALALVLVLAPAIAHAEKVFKKSESETWDCATDPVVRISQDKGTFGFLGECKRITVSGKKNVVSVASAAKLVVSGTGNFIQIDEVNTIAVSGRGNQITWAKAKTGDKPKITKGRGNTVEQKK
jgi:hypothetical protein